MKNKVKVKSLGEIVSLLTEEQMERYIVRLSQFRNMLGRAPDYFEERDIIEQVKKEDKFDILKKRPTS